MNFHPDVLAAHAEFGGDLETMQKLYEYPDLVSRISQQDAELERLRRELADVRDNLAEAEKDTHYWRVEYDKARKAAFREAGQKALEWAAHYSPASDGRNTFVLFYEWAEAKAEETRT